MKIIVNCTKEHLKKAKYCQLVLSKHFHAKEDKKIVDYFTDTSNNCWIAVALHDIFPYCDVGDTEITNSHRIESTWFPDVIYWQIDLPEIAQEKIKEFDAIANRFDKVKHSLVILTEEEKEERAEMRMAELKPFSFEIFISEHCLPYILDYNKFNIEQVKKIIEEAPHLELVE